jgi:hypothetical protein
MICQQINVIGFKHIIMYTSNADITNILLRVCIGVVFVSSFVNLTEIPHKTVSVGTWLRLQNATTLRTKRRRPSAKAFNMSMNGTTIGLHTHPMR